MQQLSAMARKTGGARDGGTTPFLHRDDQWPRGLPRGRRGGGSAPRRPPAKNTKYVQPTDAHICTTDRCQLIRIIFLEARKRHHSYVQTTNQQVPKSSRTGGKASSGRAWGQSLLPGGKASYLDGKTSYLDVNLVLCRHPTTTLSLSSS